MAKAKTGRRLKPVLEKKRRERINRNLDALRALLFRNTKDTRLQNPKVEKAEILDLAIQYIRKITCSGTDKQKVSATQTDLKVAQLQLKVAPKSVCVSYHHQYIPDFASFIGNLHPSERETILQSLEYYLDSHRHHTSSTGRETAIKLVTPGTIVIQSSSYYPYKRPSFPESSSQSCKSTHQNPINFTHTTSPNHLSPPPSPLLSSSTTTYPLCLSVAHHLPFGSFLSPPSSKRLSSIFAMLFSNSGSVKHPQLWQSHTCGGLPMPPCPSLYARAEALLSAQSAWRPWS